jgi:hypothetical protein
LRDYLPDDLVCVGLPAQFKREQIVGIIESRADSVVNHNSIEFRRKACRAENCIGRADDSSLYFLDDNRLALLHYENGVGLLADFREWRAFLSELKIKEQADNRYGKYCHPVVSY